MIYKLTGEWTGSINMASAKYYYDRDEGGYPQSLYAAVGVERRAREVPAGRPRPRGPGRRRAARRPSPTSWASRRAPRSAEGAIDAYAGALGLGVVEPGTMALITGSSHVMIGQAAEPIYGQGFWGAYTDAMIPGQYTVEAGQVSTGTVVAWFKNRFAGEAVKEAEKRGVDPYEVLTEWAPDVPIGSEGSMVLDYFQGNRSPYTDPLRARDVHGASRSATAPGTSSGRSSRASATARSTSSGPCAGTTSTRALNVVSGGPTKSDLWMQLHADVSETSDLVHAGSPRARCSARRWSRRSAPGSTPTSRPRPRAWSTPSARSSPTRSVHEEYKF